MRDGTNSARKIAHPRPIGVAMRIAISVVNTVPIMNVSIPMLGFVAQSYVVISIIPRLPFVCWGGVTVRTAVSKLFDLLNVKLVVLSKESRIVTPLAVDRVAFQPGVTVCSFTPIF